MAKGKNKKPNQEQRNRENNSLFIGIGIGAILLVLAEIFCIMGELYAMLSTNGAVIVTIISALLLFGTTGVFIYILKNTLLQKIDEQRQICEEMLQINKATYMKTKKISGQMDEEPADAAGEFHETADEIRKDIAYMLRKQNEELYKRQMSIANVQIKRIHENVAAMLDFNEQIREEIEEKLDMMSGLDSYGAAITEIRESVQELYELCEKIAEEQANVPAPILAAEPEPVYEPESEIEYEPEPIIEAESEPIGVNIEPPLEEVLENIDDSEIEAMPESEPEVEDPEPTPELEPELIMESEPEPAPMPEISGDPNRQMTAEEIAAMFANI